MNKSNYETIAALAGVSKSTVCKVLAGSAEIGAETARRVLNIAKEHGHTAVKYRKTPYAEHTKCCKIAILVPELISIYYAQRTTLAVKLLRERGIEPDIHICGFSDQSVGEVLRALSEDGITDGVLAMYATDSLHVPDIPLCVVNGIHDTVDTMVSEFYNTILTPLVQHLTALGHTDIAFVGEKNTFTKSGAFLRIMKEYRLSVPTEHLFVSDKRFEEIGQEAAGHYLDILRTKGDAAFPTAFICAYDEVALGMIDTFRAHGIRVPEDVSVVGINNIPLTAYAAVPLTTVAVDDEQLLIACIAQLFDRIEARTPTEQLLSLKTELIVRASSAQKRTHQITVR